MIKIAKFGGTSLAEASQFKKARDILLKDDAIMVAVPSAPGKRSAGDVKITDMLIGCHEDAASGRDFSRGLDAVAERFNTIKAALGADTDIDSEIEKIKADIKSGAGEDYVKSRGEYLSGKLLAAYTGWSFLDPADVIKFDDEGELDIQRTYELIRRGCSGQKTVLPGFYGSGPDGGIITFSRGGSDVTGSLAAAALDADVYENWTDVSGFYMTDPRVVPDVRHIDTISYEELRELSYMGAGVLHENAIFPVRKKRIPINIKNTNRPQDPGTMIVAKQNLKMHELPITGIAGKQGFAVINIYKEAMNSELGFARRILSVLEDNGISFEHMPTGIDTISVVIADDFLKGKEETVIEAIKQAVKPDEIELIPDLALIATCGHGMVHHEGTAARLFSALAKSGVNIRMIDQGSSELNIIVGIENADYEKAIRAIYDGFVN